MLKMFHIYFNAGSDKINMLEKITNAQYQKKGLSNVVLCYEQNLCFPSKFTDWNSTPIHVMVWESGSLGEN